MDQFNSNMNDTLERGQKLDEGVAKSDELMTTSNNYKNTARGVNRAMCCRKYMVYFIGVGVLAAVIGLIILIIKV